MKVEKARAMANFEDAALLLHIGAPRTGSKWTTQFCSDHPEILMSPIKNLHYFDDADGIYHEQFAERFRRLKKRYDRGASANPPPIYSLLFDRLKMRADPDAYLDYFRRRWRGERILCDVTPSYHWQDEKAYRRMQAAHSQVKFLLILRNPVDRLWSTVKLAKSRNPDRDVETILVERLANRAPPQWARYRHALEMLDKTVPSGDVHIDFFERYFSTNAVERLCEFLHIDMESALLGPPVNQGAPVDLSATNRARLFEALKSEYDICYERFGAELPSNWTADMGRFG